LFLFFRIEKGTKAINEETGKLFKVLNQRRKLLGFFIQKIQDLGEATLGRLRKRKCFLKKRKGKGKEKKRKE